MKKVSIITVAIFLFFCCILMARAASNTVPGGSDHPTQQRGSVPDALVRPNNTFALDLFKRLSGKEGNLFFSPFSISCALAMTYAGARGETERQMASVLRFPLNQVEFHPAFSKLIKALDAGTKGKPYQLRIANALWGQRDYGFLPAFVDLIRKYYGGSFFTVDFEGHTEEARKEINRWIEKKTEEKIKDLLHPGDINSLTRLVLTNAIYFKGNWASKFKKEATRPMTFHISPTKSIKVPMMFQERKFPYYEGETLQILELPYAGKDLAMVIFLPKKSASLSSLEKGLSGEKLREWIGRLRSRKVRVYLPRFKLKTRYLLGPILSAMGMPQAFSGNADFSGMTGRKELEISKVIHQAFVVVNEEGTEAAAATAVAIRLKAVMFAPTFRADHPFFFLILHEPTGEILFMGRLTKP